MAISTVRRLAADIFNVGENRVKISPEGVQEAEGALTRVDVKALIEKGIITKVRKKGRASTSKGRRRSPGHRKGAVLSQKDVWMEKVRAQRKFLAMLLSSGALKKQHKWSVYRKVKSGLFRNKRAMLLYLKDNALVAKDYEPPKPGFRNAGKKPAAKAPPPQPKSEKPVQKPTHEKKGESK